MLKEIIAQIQSLDEAAMAAALTGIEPAKLAGHGTGVDSLL